MSVLVLVRHAQASFFADDYDSLSPLGEAQARLLGEHWVRQRKTFSEVYVGPRLRHRQTAGVVADVFRRAGLAWPETALREELDEYDLAGLLNRFGPRLASGNSVFKELADAYQRSEESDRTRAFQQMFEVLLAHWQTPPFASEEVETWADFRNRVERALGRITAGLARGRRAAAFTSGGFIGTAAALTLGAPDCAALELSSRLRNASLTHFVFTTGRRTLDDFNTVPHLPDAAHRTYR